MLNIISIIHTNGGNSTVRIGNAKYQLILDTPPKRMAPSMPTRCTPPPPFQWRQRTFFLFWFSDGGGVNYYTLSLAWWCRMTHNLSVEIANSATAWHIVYII